MHTRLSEGVVGFGILALSVVALAPAQGQIYETNNVMVQTFVGSAFSGYLDGVGQQTMFSRPTHLAADSAGNIFVYDSGNLRIRKITPDGTVSTFAGGGKQPPPGQGTNVYFIGSVNAMIVDHSDTLWVAGQLNQPSLTSIQPDGYVSEPVTLTDLPSGPGDMCLDSRGNIYLSAANRIYRYETNGILSVFAGSGNTGGVDGNGIFSSFDAPSALAVDSADTIYVWEGRRIRRVFQNRDVVTLLKGQLSGVDVDGVGTNASISRVSALSIDKAGNLIAAGEWSIRRITAQTNVTTLAGSFTENGDRNGTGNIARFNFAEGLCIVSNVVYVADSYNHRIRSISFDPPEQPVSAASLDLNTYPGLKITGTIGRTYRIEASSDGTSWSPLETLLLTRNPYLWIDPAPATAKRMYRAFLLP